MTEILHILADGRFHSGEDLGRCLGISRAAVWKRLHALRGRGFEIHSVRGRGYRLAAPIELLSSSAIREAMPAAMRQAIAGLEIHDEIDSTNSELLRRAAVLPSGTACLAEFQLHGRGRRGRAWLAPGARNLCLSLLWRFPSGPDTLGGLGLVVGLAVHEALTSAGVGGIGLKWPNDIVGDAGKLAGVLIELSGESGAAACVVIGIGINVDMPAATPIDQPWIDVAGVTGAPVSRNLLAAAVLVHLVDNLRRFQHDGLPPLLERWRAHDVLAGRAVCLRSGDDHELHGIARGVDDDGALLLEHAEGIGRYHAGDVSLRAAASPAIAQVVA